MSGSLALPPGPRSFLSIREVLAVRRDLIGFLNHVKSYGDIACFRLGPQLCYYANHPDYFHDILLTHHQVLQKTWILRRAEDGFGKGILMSTGEAHKRQRKMLQPAFHKQRIGRYMQTMIDVAERDSNSWQDGATVDMAQEMQRTTISVAAQTLFGTDFAEEAQEIGEALAVAVDLFTQIKGPFAFFLSNISIAPRNIRFERAKRRVHAIIHKLIAQRRESGEERDDFLAMLLAAQHEDSHEGLSDEQIRDEAVSIFISGFETSTNTLSWAWYMLSKNPDVEEELHRELDTVLGGRLPTPEDLERLTFTRKVIAEVLRHYPSVYVIPRRVTESCPLGQFTMPPGSLVFVGIYTIQHDARFYDEPERFKPNRWTSEMSSKLPRFAFSAFGGGPHACLGEHFAWAETVLLLSVLAQRWKARVPDGHEVKMNPLVNLRPLGGIPMKLTRR